MNNDLCKKTAGLRRSVEQPRVWMVKGLVGGDVVAGEEVHGLVDVLLHDDIVLDEGHLFAVCLHDVLDGL